MAELLVKTSVKLGKAIPVKNLDKQMREETKSDRILREPEVYWAIQVEDYDGGNERCLLLTHHELFEVAPRFELPREMTDKLLMGRMYPIRDGVKSGYFIKIVSFQEDGTPYDSKPTTLYVGDWLVEKARTRAARHPQSVTEKHWLIDWLD